MKNIISSDNGGIHLATSLFHNEADHIFLQTVLKLFDSIFVNGKYTSSGGIVLTKAIEELCGEPMANIMKYNTINSEKMTCYGMTIAEPSLFFPYDWFHHVELGEKKSKHYWDEKFKKSLAVTYYEASSMFTPTRSSPSVLRPNIYGREKPALAYLGPKECPISFYSVKPF